jgi:hypothetical protein
VRRLRRVPGRRSRSTTRTAPGGSCSCSAASGRTRRRRGAGRVRVPECARRVQRAHVRAAGARGGHRVLRAGGSARRRAGAGRSAARRRSDTVDVKRSIVLAAVLALLVAGSASGAVRKPWLWQCTQIHNADPQYRCYVRLLRLDIEQSGDPARELPRIDRRVRRVGGPIEAGCHVLMHQVGREYAQDHHVTLSTLQRFVPESNDPNCSAGFGMGLVMYLGPQILRSGGGAAVHACAQLPTRYRQYTCVHGLGHALLRAYHGSLGRPCARAAGCRRATRPTARRACSTTTGSRCAAPTGRRARATPSRRRGSICDGRYTYVRPCWYRYFLEQPLGLPIRNAADLRRACRGLRSIQRFGCISGATLELSSDPFEQMRACRSLRRPRRVRLRARSRRPGARRRAAPAARR